MGACHFLVLSAGKPHAHKIPPFWGGGCWVFLGGGGGSANFVFMGAGIFLISEQTLRVQKRKWTLQNQHNHFPARRLM